MTVSPQEKLLRDLFDAALAAVDAERRVPPLLPSPPKGRTVVAAIGKAAAAMAQAVERHWRGELSGIALTRDDHGCPLERIELVEAAHPVPDARGQKAARRLLALAAELGPDDLLLALISGGGSALLAVPAPGLTLEDKQAVTRMLLRSGAAIREINTVRRHLSAVKGGRLAVAAYPARVVTLLVSDVPGDDPATIASGPTVVDPSRAAEAMAVLRHYAIAAPGAVIRHLEASAGGDAGAAHPVFANAVTRFAATPIQALEAAAEAARVAGFTPLILGDAIEGEAREVGRAMAGIALSVRQRGHPVSGPAILLSGGETTVTVTGDGRGGRNAEFLLGLALALDGAPGVYALAADTDGVDGSESDAGAIITPSTLARARAAGLDPGRLLANNDAWTLFAALGALVTTGPTLTNVNDFRAILIENEG